MKRIAALFAMIALAGMSMGMAAAHRVSAAPMAHMPAAPMQPCTDGPSIGCELCCAVAPSLAAFIDVGDAPKPGFTPAATAPQTGLATPPALPPPRLAARRK